MLNTQRRHRPPCKKSEWDPGYTKCTCPIVIRGTLGGRPILLSTAKYLPPNKSRDLEAARDLAILWERAGKPVRPEAYAPPAADAAPVVVLPTIDMAVKSFLDDGVALANGDATLYKKRNVFSTGKESLSLSAFASEKGVRSLQEVDLAFLRDWRATWKVEALSRHKRQCQVIGFLWYCERAGWLPRNFAFEMTKAPGRIKVTATQTGCFSPDEYKAIVDATFIYTDRPSIDKHDSTTLGGERIRALTELMRWTGLRIRDAVCLDRSRLSLDPATGMWSVQVCQRKTGDPVYCPIPPHVADQLNSIPPGPKQIAGGRYFFWTGNGLPKTIVSNWQRSYGKLFKLAALKDADGNSKRAHPHSVASMPERPLRRRGRGQYVTSLGPRQITGTAGRDHDDAATATLTVTAATCSISAPQRARPYIRRMVARRGR